MKSKAESGIPGIHLRTVGPDISDNRIGDCILNHAEACTLAASLQSRSPKVTNEVFVPLRVNPLIIARLM